MVSSNAEPFANIIEPLPLANPLTRQYCSLIEGLRGLRNTPRHRYCSRPIIGEHKASEAPLRLFRLGFCLGVMDISSRQDYVFLDVFQGSREIDTFEPVRFRLTYLDLLFVHIIRLRCIRS